MANDIKKPHRNRKHGHCPRNGKPDRRYEIWKSIKQRATNPACGAAANYVNRGIGICSEWMTYDGFMKWDKFHEMRPGLHVDRIDNSKGYSPENCRLVTQCENNRNSRKVKLNMQSAHVIRMLCWSGLSHQIVADIFGVSRQCIQDVVAFRRWSYA